MLTINVNIEFNPKCKIYTAPYNHLSSTFFYSIFKQSSKIFLWSSAKNFKQPQSKTLTNGDTWQRWISIRTKKSFHPSTFFTCLTRTSNKTSTLQMTSAQTRVKVSRPHLKRCGEKLLSPTFLPASLAHLRMEVTSLPFVLLHWERTAAALTPTVPSLALTPQRKAVAVPALSATCAFVLYVCTQGNKPMALP